MYMAIIEQFISYFPTTFSIRLVHINAIDVMFEFL